MNKNRDLSIQTHRTFVAGCSKIPFKKGIVNTRAYSTGKYPPFYYAIRDSIEDADLLMLAASRERRVEEKNEKAIDITSVKRTPSAEIPDQPTPKKYKKKPSFAPVSHVPISIPHKAAEVSEHPVVQAMTSLQNDLKQTSKESKRYYKPRDPGVLKALDALFSASYTSYQILTHHLLSYIAESLSSDPPPDFQFVIHPLEHTLMITNTESQFKLSLEITPPTAPDTAWDTSIWLTPVGPVDTTSTKLPLIDRLQGTSISFTDLCTILLVFRSVSRAILLYINSGPDMSERFILWGFIKRAFEESELDGEVATSTIKRHLASKLGHKLVDEKPKVVKKVNLDK